MSKDIRHDWNYIGNGIYKCVLCGFRKGVGENTNLRKEICDTKQRKENLKLSPMIRRLIERNN